MKRTSKSTATPLGELRSARLADPKRAAYALELARKEFEEDNNVDAFLETLRVVAQAQGGLAALSRKSAISRQALHEALSPQGNPRLRTLQTLLENMGLRITFKAIKTTRPTRPVAKKAARPKRVAATS